jgi:hypothetical protein
LSAFLKEVLALTFAPLYIVGGGEGRSDEHSIQFGRPKNPGCST